MATNAKGSMKLIIIAIVLGIVGALLAMLYLNAKEAQLREQLKPRSQPIGVVVASRDLVKGEVLDSRSLVVRQIPRGFVSNLAVLPGDFEKVEGKILQVNLARGKPLLNTFIGSEFPLDFSDTIIEKRRGMTIQVDEINSFTGLLRPGNKIDLFVRSDSSLAGSDSKEIVPVLENVEVIATGKDSAYDYEEKVRLLRGGIGANPQQNYTTITLNVTPKQAAILSLAEDSGDIIALLRNRKDTSGSGFVSVDNDSILDNANQLAIAAEQRESAKQLGENIVVGEDGVLRTRDGKILKNQNLVIGPDGSIRTKSGIDLASRGLSINENGEIVDANGNVVDPDDLIVLADGTLMTKDGVILDGPKVKTLAGGLRVAEDGSIIAADGTVIKGATLDENGNLVLADGTVVDPNDLVINSDGTISTKDGTLLAGLSAEAPPEGAPTLLADGSVRLADGTVISGATIDSDGNLVLADGTVVNPDDIVINADGSITTKDGRALAGLVLESDTDSGGFIGTVDYIVGGASKDGVAEVNKVPVAE